MEPDMIQVHITWEEVQEPEPIKVNAITQKPEIKQVKVKVTYPEGRIKHFHPNIKFTGPSTQPRMSPRESVNGFINRAILETMERDGGASATFESQTEEV